MVDTVNTVNMSMYDISSRMTSGFSTIAVYTSTAQSGTFSELTVSATRLTLISTTQYYTYSHTATGISDNWYKYKLFNGATSASSFQTAAFKGNTSDLTEDLRNMLDDTDDTISDYKYTIKQLRRFIRIGCNKLQQTPYRFRFKADFNGIISPQFSNMDAGLLLLQGRIQTLEAQRAKAADCNISFSDGRGRFNNRTAEALTAIIKDSVIERNDLIAKYNKVLGNATARVVMWTQMSGVST